MLGTPRWTVWAGSAFEPPEDIGVGKSRFLEVLDFGEPGVAARWQQFLADKEAAATTVAGHACWHSAARVDRVEHPAVWYALVGDRFVVEAWDRDVFIEAMQRRGDLATILAPFGDLSFLPADASHIVCSLPRAAEPSADYAFVPKQPMLFVVAGQPKRFAIYSRSDPPSDYTELVAKLWRTPRPPVERISGWRCQEDVIADEQQLDVHLGVLFGLRFFL